MSNLKGHSKACWNAKGKHCKCRCKKVYHGLGHKKTDEAVHEEDENREPNLDELIQENHAYTLEDVF